jgi:cation/acetate symporter
VAIVAALMTLYVVTGGMLTATWVQIIKAFLLVVAITTLSVLCLIKAGSFANLYEQASGLHRMGGNIFLPGGSNSTMFSAISLAFGLVGGMVGMPHLLIRFFTVPSERAAQQSTLVAVSITVFVFLLMFTIIGPSTIAFLTNDPLYVDASAAVRGGPNMASIHLSKTLGGEFLFGVTSAVAFATILAVVSGLVMASASAASHDLFKTLVGGPVSERTEMMAFRLAAVGIGGIAATFAVAFRNENVAFLTALAFTVAASSTLPILLLTIYWRGLTGAGAVWGGGFGLAASVTLIILGPSVWVKLLGHTSPLFPSDYPSLLVAPLATAVAITVSLLSRDTPRAKFTLEPET